MSRVILAIMLNKMSALCVKTPRYATLCYAPKVDHFVQRSYMSCSLFLHPPLPTEKTSSSKVDKCRLVLCLHVRRIIAGPRERLGLVFVEISRVVRALEMRHNGTGLLAFVNDVPVHILEPRMRFDCGCAARDVTKTLGDVDCAQTADDGAGVVGHCGREANLALDYLLVNLHWVLVPEGRLPNKELVD